MHPTKSRADKLDHIERPAKDVAAPQNQIGKKKVVLIGIPDAEYLTFLMHTDFTIEKLRYLTKKMIKSQKKVLPFRLTHPGE